MRRLLAVLALLLVVVPAASGEVRLRVLPPVAGLSVKHNGVTYKTDSDGFVSIAGTRRDVRPENVTIPELKRGGKRYKFDRWFGPSTGADMVAGMLFYQRTVFDFRNLDGDIVPIDQIQLLRVKAQTGQVVDRTAQQLADSVELLAQRVQPLGGGPVVKDVNWSAQIVQIRGTNVVRSSAQKWTPSTESKVTFELDFYPMEIRAIDAFYGRGASGDALVEFPDGHTQVYALKHGRAVIPALPRGTYEVTIRGGGQGIQDAGLTLETADRGVQGHHLARLRVGRAVRHLLPGRTAGDRPAAPPPTARAGSEASSSSRRAHGSVRCFPVARRPSFSCSRSLRATIGPGTGEARAAAERPPVLAYYYIWYTPTSWNRAKSDYPLLGRYDSGDANVMRKQIQWAKESGIDGFIVSWKSTTSLDQRLATLVRVADEEQFKLGIIYQGLDFERHPVPVAQVAEDLETFADRYADDPAFKIFDKPLVVWSGTWEFSARQVQEGTHLARNRLLVLGSGRNTRDYERIAPYVDGNAYYWSSVNPDTFPDYQGKLDEMVAGGPRPRRTLDCARRAGFDARAARRQDGRRPQGRRHAAHRVVGGREVVARRGRPDLVERVLREQPHRTEPDIPGPVPQGRRRHHRRQGARHRGVRLRRRACRHLGLVRPPARRGRSRLPRTRSAPCCDAG